MRGQLDDANSRNRCAAPESSIQLSSLEVKQEVPYPQWHSEGINTDRGVSEKMGQINGCECKCVM